MRLCEYFQHIKWNTVHLLTLQTTKSNVSNQTAHLEKISSAISTILPMKGDEGFPAFYSSVYIHFYIHFIFQIEKKSHHGLAFAFPFDTHTHTLSRNETLGKGEEKNLLLSSEIKLSKSQRRSRKRAESSSEFLIKHEQAIRGCFFSSSPRAPRLLQQPNIVRAGTKQQMKLKRWSEEIAARSLEGVGKGASIWQAEQQYPKWYPAYTL